MSKSKISENVPVRGNNYELQIDCISQYDWVLTDQNSLQYKQSESSARSRRAQQWISDFLSLEYSQLSFCWILRKTINTSRLSSQINWMN